MIKKVNIQILNSFVQPFHVRGPKDPTRTHQGTPRIPKDLSGISPGPPRPPRVPTGPPKDTYALSRTSKSSKHNKNNDISMFS